MVLLKFNEPLVSPKGTISTKTLLVRLESLHNELASLEQDSVDVNSLETVKDALISSKLTKNSNQGVQVYVACCIVDILRFYAPDAPYNGTQLSEVFRLFFRQIKQLKSTDSGFYNEQAYLVQRMAEVKVSVILTDLPDSVRLTDSAFDVIFSVAESKHFDESLEPQLLEILSEVIAESATLPPKAMKRILNKFLAHSKTSVPGFSFTLKLCSVNADSLSRLVTGFMSETVYELTNHEILDIDKLNKVHLIIVEVWRYVPQMLATVMGLVNNELEVDDERIRVLATQAIGEMLVCNSSLRFSSDHVNTYRSWVKKPRDRSPMVRTAWVHTTSEIFAKGTANVYDDLRAGIQKTLVDLDEKVRLATLNELCKLHSETFFNRVLSESLLDVLKKLLRERTGEIRQSCIQLLTNLYNDSPEEASWVPEELFKLVYINDPRVNAQMDTAIIEKVLPYNTDPEARVQRLLYTFSVLSDRARSSFFAFVRRQAQLAEMLPRTFDLAEQYAEDVSLEPKLDTIVLWLTRDFPPEFNSVAALKQFLVLNNHRYFRTIKLALTSDYEAVHDSIEELLDEVHIAQNIRVQGSSIPSVSTVQMQNTLRLLCYRAANIIYNKSNIPTILEVNNSQTALQPAAAQVLDSISSVNPAALKASMTQLIQSIGGSGHQEANLKAIYNFASQFPETVSDRMGEFQEKLVQLAAQGSYKEAKYSVRIIGSSHLTFKGSLLQDVLDASWPLDETSGLLNTHLAAISELFVADLVLMESKAKELSDILASRILLHNQTVGSENDNDTEWLDEGEDTACLSKLLALRIFTSWLDAIQKDRQEEINAVADPIFKMLGSILNNGGEIVSQSEGTYPTPRAFQSRLRLEAGVRLLKLAQFAPFDSKFDRDVINRMVFLIQDENEHVRRFFLRKLSKRLTSQSIPKRFLPLVFFVAHEPVKELKDETSTWIRAAFRRQLLSHDGSNHLLFETSYIRLLNMLSHHQEVEELYETSMETEDEFEQLANFTLTYIVFALGLISTQDNISMLFYLTQRIKQYNDVMGNNDRLYFVSDLAQMTIKQLSDIRGWTLKTWPGKLSLPADMYVKNRDEESVKSVIATSYIPERWLAKTCELVKAKCKRATSPVKRTRTVTKRVLEESNRAEPAKKLAAEHPTRKSAIPREAVDYNEEV